MSGEPQKVTMKESELQALVEQKAAESVEKKLTGLMEEVKCSLGDYAKNILKEQLKDSLSKINPAEDKALEEAKKEANKFKTFGEFLVSVRRYRQGRGLDERLSYVTHDGRIAKSAGDIVSIAKTAGHMVESEDSQGGFLVPEVYRADLQEIALETAIVRPNGATIIPSIATDSVKIPFVNDVSHASTVYGGVQATWTAEKAAKDATKPTFGQMELIPKKLAGITYTSNELLADSAIALEPLIRRMFGTAWGYFEDDAFINGNGGGTPLGIQNCGCLKTVLRNTANRVFFEDLRELYACMLPSSHPYAIWVINPGVLPDLIGMQSGDAAPATGGNVVWINNNMGAANPIPGRILGRPFFISEKMRALGSQGDIGYFDMRYYLIFDRQPITIDVSPHVAFTTDETCWRFVIRVDGQCWPQSTITPRYAGAPVTTISPFVVLASATS